MEFDFSGWATKNDLKCSDGRTIRANAFKDNDGQIVPLVWNHCHNDPTNVLGKALLQNRPEGVYAYGKFNDTEAGRLAKQLVRHGDVDSLSIFANQLQQTSNRDVLHGKILELSLVLAGANTGAKIDNIMAHGEGHDDEAVIFTGEFIEHSEGGTYDDEKKKENTVPAPKAEQSKETSGKESKKSDEEPEKDTTIKDIWETFTEDEKNAVYAIIAMAENENSVVSHAASQSKDDEDDEDDYDDEDDEDEDDLEHAKDGKTVKEIFDAMSEEKKNVAYAIIGMATKNKNTSKKDEGDKTMKHNAYDPEETMTGNATGENVLSHSELMGIIDDGPRYGSLKESMLQHGVTNIEYFFPDHKNVQATPVWVKRPTEWVAKFLNATKRTPFSRIKSMYADITEPEARAKGYIKGNEKFDEVFPIFKRVTDPTMVYKKQHFDREDLLDIQQGGFDFVSWIKGEMRLMLDEEIARAALLGDGRSAIDRDKIDPTHIRPIWTDDDHYTIKKAVVVAAGATDDQKAKAFIRTCIKSRKEYKGAGNPILFTTEDMLTDMLLMEDGIGRVIYETVDKLKTALRVSDIVTVPQIESATRIVDGETRQLLGIYVNPSDYNIGADKGGSATMFDDFDIDYNKEKYLIETYCSGALVVPFAAVALELSFAVALEVTPTDSTETVLGKAVSDLQKGVAVNDDYISGTLKYVTNYTGYSQDPAENSGNFLALDFSATEGSTVTIEVVGSGKPAKALDSDMQAVIRVTNKAYKLKVVCTTAGNVVDEKVFALSALKLLNA